MSEAARLVLTTFGNPEDAVQVARMLVVEKLAACGTVLPGARSIYAWEGKIEESAETVVIFKTTATRLEDFQKRLAELHPYEVPEIVALDPAAVAPAYAKWVAGWVGA